MDDDADSLKRRTAERIAEVRARFSAGLGQRVDGLAALAISAGGGDRQSATTAADNLRLGLHNLAGGAPTLGLGPLGDAAAELEKRLAAERLPDGGLDPAVARTLAASIERLSELA